MILKFCMASLIAGPCWLGWGRVYIPPRPIPRIVARTLGRQGHILLTYVPNFLYILGDGTQFSRDMGLGVKETAV